MFKITASLSNPFFKEMDTPQMDFYYWEGPVFSTKALSVQVSKFEASELFSFMVDLNWRGSDHAGPKLDIGMLGLNFMIDFYDTRHWNYEQNRWYKHGEETAEWEARNNKT